MLSTIEHVGVVVDNVAEAKVFLGDVLGLEFHREVELPDRGVKAAFFKSGSIQIEVIECINAESRSRRLGPDGTMARIEHIAILVDDLAGHLDQLRASGVRTVPPEPPYTVTPGRTWVMTDPETTDGVMYQIIQLDA
jgi:methylmalonyl-CoA/ethylmalonyl-CoA epimerase